MQDYCLLIETFSYINSPLKITESLHSMVIKVYSSQFLDYSPNNFAKLKEMLGLISTMDPKHRKKIINQEYYLPIAQCEGKLISAVEQLQADSHYVPREQREKRATGSAFQVAISLLNEIGINTRFVATIGGPCTIGPGKVVDLPRKKTIRAFVDIIEGN